VRADASLGVLLVELHFPDSRSLKDKRQPLTSLRDVVQRRFRAAFSEVAHQETWQRAGVLIAVAASSPAQAAEQLDEIERYLHSREFEVSRTVVRAVDTVEALWDAASFA
jgi:uncharacterized protein YlxP (DUF503 family)